MNLKNFKEWRTENYKEDLNMKNFRNFAGSNLQADPDIVRILKTRVMQDLTEKYPENQAALEALIAAATHLLLDTARNFSASQATRLMSQDHEI